MTVYNTTAMKEDILQEIDQLKEGKANQKEIVAKAKLLLKEIQSDKTTFPVDAFPKDLADIIQNFHDCYKFPIDYYGLGVLTTASALIGNAYAAAYQPRWWASPMIFGIIVGNSGVGKSKALTPVLAPVKEVQDELNDDFTELMEAHMNEVQSIKDSQLDEDIPPPPDRKRIMLNKATMEAIESILSKNPRGCLLVRQELSGWLKSMNQYRAGDDGETWLEIWDNEDIIKDRVGKDLFIKRANVNILGGIQPHVIQELASDSRAENGFLARLLFAYPDDLDKPYPSKTLPHHSVYDRYKEIMKILHNLPNEFTEPVNEHDYWKIETINLPLSNSARELYYQFLIDSTDEQNGNDNNMIKAILAKLDTYCLRFCCILELLEFVCRQPKDGTAYMISTDEMEKITIGTQTVKNAIKLVNYFKKTAQKVTQQLDGPAGKLPSDQKAWYYSLSMDNEYSTADLKESGEGVGLSVRTIERLLGRKDLFKKIKRGTYERVTF